MKVDMGDGRLVVVSNRLPLQTVVGPDGKVVLQPGGGGLVAAMQFVLERSGGTWIGWPGEGDIPDFEGLTTDLPFRVVPVSLTKEEVQGYYDGFTNRTLWPLFHDMVGRTVFDHDWWDSYVTVNEKFTQAIAESSEPGDLVWIHDFHLLLVAQKLREHERNPRLGFFLHTPFPPFMIFQRLPWRSQIARALLSFDTLGFHTERDLGSFVRTVLALCPEARPVDLSDQRATWDWDGRTVQAGVFPISIDFNHWDALGRNRTVNRKAERFRERNAHRKIILGVDRMDYSKGIPQRIRAFAELLARHPEEREQVQFLQIAVPSRSSISEYKVIKKEIDSLIGQINGRFGTPNWVPVNYLYRRFDPAELAAYYKAADVALLTPLKDGMNLVAKEFAAASVEGGGVLILSEFAGAAFEMEQGALIVNPHDTVEVAAALHHALHMPLEEQETRMESLRAVLRNYDVHKWSQEFIAAARGVEARLVNPEELLAAWEGWTGSRLLLHVDYDGTLSPTHPFPEQAAPDRELLACIDDLAALPGLQVVIASGRSIRELSAWFTNQSVVLVGDHGASWRHGRMEGPLMGKDSSLDAIQEAHDALVPVVDEAPGARLENKGYSLAIHYRQVPEFVRPRLLPKVRRVLRAFVANGRGLRIIEGRFVLELSIAGEDTGKALQQVRRELGYESDPVAAIGDGSMDEDVFTALGDVDLAVHVGRGPTSARYVLARPADVRLFLTRLVEARKG